MLARQAFRDGWWISAGYFVLLAFSLIAAILFWPDLRDNLPSIAKLIPIEALRDVIDRIEEGGYWAYFTFQQFFKNVNLFGLAAAAVLGTGMVAREAENRTAEFLLSRPVSRIRILLTRWAVGVGLLTVPIFLSTYVGMLIGPLVADDMTVEFGPATEVSFYMSLFLTMLFTATVWLSTYFDSQIRAGAVIVGLGLLQFALYLIKVVGDYSLFKLTDMMVLGQFTQGEFPTEKAGIIVAATAVMLVLAVRKFAKRDF